MPRVLFAVLLLLGLAACGETVPAPEGGQDGAARVLVMGDSLMAWNRPAGKQVARALAARLGQEVADRSTLGARHFYPLPFTGAAGLSIPLQWRGGSYDWVVLNGGGNDLMFGCGCGPCTGTMNRLISEDGKTGAIPELVARIRASGARVIHAGYLRTTGPISPVRGCRPLGNELETRLARMAASDTGLYFVALSDLVLPGGDAALFAADLMHPSTMGSAAIAERIARIIAR
jgi:acyl-CoA thioesterase I